LGITLQLLRLKEDIKPSFCQQSRYEINPSEPLPPLTLTHLCKELSKAITEIPSIVRSKFLTQSLCQPQRFVTRSTQDEALLWKIAVLGMQKAPLDTGTICSLPIHSRA
jgi:hypothetical protein